MRLPENRRNLVLEAESPAGFGGAIAGWTILFDPAGQNDFRHTGHDHCGSGKNRLHTGDADPVYGGSWNRIRYARQQRADSSDVQAFFGLHAAAVANIIDQCRIDARPLTASLMVTLASVEALRSRKFAKSPNGSATG